MPNTPSRFDVVGPDSTGFVDVYDTQRVEQVTGPWPAAWSLAALTATDRAELAAALVPPLPGALAGITWEAPPTQTPELAVGPSPAQILAALDSRPGEWAVVARPDRASRAERVRDRLDADGYEAVVVKVGPEHRVYARRTA